MKHSLPTSGISPYTLSEIEVQQKRQNKPVIIRVLKLSVPESRKMKYISSLKTSTTAVHKLKSAVFLCSSQKQEAQYRFADSREISIKEHCQILMKDGYTT